METKMSSESSYGSYSWFRSMGTVRSEPRHSRPAKASVESSVGQKWEHQKGVAMDDGYGSDMSELFVFGYSCKLFRDDQKAEDMDCGRHLIGWNGSTDHLIDRFDVRGYLNDLSQYESNYKNTYEPLSAEELEIEQLCDSERFADLSYEHMDDDHDEEIKRLHLALADGTTYSQISYNYDENNDISTEPTTEVTEAEPTVPMNESDRFKLPSGLSPPEGMALPESQKLHNIIEKTASFVRQHGIQMEIVLKTKQSSNRNFDFLSFDSELYPYYKYILENIKSGKYIPKPTQTSDNSDSDDSDDEHYLHPSLLGSSSKSRESQAFNIPSLLRAATDDDSYSQLVKSFRDRFPVTEEPIEEPEAKPLSAQTQNKLVSIESSESTKNDNNIREKMKNCLANVSQTSWSSLLPSPPPETEQIIEKLAQHVARSGEQFEASIKKLGEHRFEFVNPGHIYHAHYIRRKLHYLEENRKAQAAQLKLNHKKPTKSDSHSSKTPVSFSINPKDTKPSASVVTTSDENLLTVGANKREDSSDPEMTAKRMNENALKDKLALAVRDRAAKEKQEERKRKAALFLSALKNKSKELKKSVESTESVSESAFTYGPEPPKAKTSSRRAKSAPLSPTTFAVTSPKSSPENKSSLNESLLSEMSSIHTKSGSLLPFIVSDKPLKVSTRVSPPHKHHKSRHSSGHKKSHKRKRSTSRSTSRSPTRSHRKHSKHSTKSRSRSRSRSHSRSHKRR